MKRNLFTSIVFAVLACVPLLSAQAQQSQPALTFNYSDTPNPQIQFASASPNGGLASIAFPTGSTPPALVSISAVTAVSNNSPNPNLTYRILWCPLTNGKYPPSKSQTLTNPTTSNGTSLTLVANSSAMMVLQYQDSASAPWTSFDRVTLMDASANPILNQAASSANGNNFYFNFKSKDGSHGASVVIAVPGTTVWPIIPHPKHGMKQLKPAKKG